MARIVAPRAGRTAAVPAPPAKHLHGAEQV